jgi:hypothetical protein
LKARSTSKAGSAWASRFLRMTARAWGFISRRVSMVASRRADCSCVVRGICRVCMKYYMDVKYTGV